MKTKVILAVVFLLALCQASHAADLQAGWYVKNLMVDAYTFAPFNGPPEPTSVASFLTAPAQYGPFGVTSNPSSPESLDVSVPVNAYGVTPDQSLTLPLHFPAWADEAEDPTMAYIAIDYTTDYDPDDMILQFWHRSTDGSQQLVWTQSNGGVQFAEADVAYNTPYTGSYFFEVAVVPEPSAALCLVIGCASLCHVIRRRA